MENKEKKENSEENEKLWMWNGGTWIGKYWNGC
jgi:hypothetical protein